MQISAEELEALPIHQLGIAFDRALKDRYLDPDEAFEDDGFVKEFTEIVISFLNQNAIDGLVAKGLLRSKSVNRDGEVVYEATELGNQVIQNGN